MHQNSNNLQIEHDIKIVPYVKIDGMFSIPDEWSISVFNKIKKDGLFEKVFYDGEVRTQEDFLNLLKSPVNYPIFILVDGILLCLAWINDLHSNHATVHFYTFKESWGRHSMAMGQKAIEYWFNFKKEDGSNRFDVLLGITPSEYKSVHRFIEKIGFTILGEVPKVLFNIYTQQRMGAMLSFCTRKL
ncbi:MAG: hypothetical protein PHE50_00210 [Dehalococcoidales bacterium]|nr:hypothetical protein [Dehalococcoidales bacterium]